MFLGDELTDILESIVNDSDYDKKEAELLRVGVHILPKFPKDTTDRNRTSPFAFTGNKFEFRMLGSDLSISGPNVVLNTIVAEELSQFADELENAEDFETALHTLIQKTIKEHKRIIFNGNNYAPEWVDEAAKRGLLNLKTTADALPAFIAEKNIAMFTKHKIFTTTEIRSRYDILMDEYCKKLHIEALTMVDMAQKQILPAVSAYVQKLTKLALDKKALCADLPVSFETETVAQLSAYAADMQKALATLSADIDKAEALEDVTARANAYKDTILADMDALRAAADAAEALTAQEDWPFPSYTELLYSV